MLWRKSFGLTVLVLAGVSLFVLELLEKVSVTPEAWGKFDDIVTSGSDPLPPDARLYGAIALLGVGIVLAVLAAQATFQGIHRRRSGGGGDEDDHRGPLGYGAALLTILVAIAMGTGGGEFVHEKRRGGGAEGEGQGKAPQEEKGEPVVALAGNRAVAHRSVKKAAPAVSRTPRHQGEEGANDVGGVLGVEIAAPADAEEVLPCACTSPEPSDEEGAGAEPEDSEGGEPEGKEPEPEGGEPEPEGGEPEPEGGEEPEPEDEEPEPEVGEEPGPEGGGSDPEEPESRSPEEAAPSRGVQPDQLSSVPS